MLNLAFVERFAWHKFRCDAHKSTEDSSGAGQTASELGVVRGVRVLDARVDDGTDAGAEACSYDGSDDYRPCHVAGPDELDFSSGQRH